MRAVLAARRPDDAILGEEDVAKPGTTGLTWVIDPIDGTRAFISGTPTWGVLIALSDAQGPRYGIIDQPYIGERFEGGFGLARLTGPRGERPLATRATAGLAAATLFTTFPEVGTPAERAGFETRAATRVKLTRLAAHGLLRLTAPAGRGHVDLRDEAGLASYDILRTPTRSRVIEAARRLVVPGLEGTSRAPGRCRGGVPSRSNPVHAIRPAPAPAARCCLMPETLCYLIKMYWAQGAARRRHHWD